MAESFYIQKLCLYKYEIPFKTTVCIRGIPFTSKKGLLNRIEDKEGNVSWGEISLLPPTEERIKECIRWVEENYRYILGDVDVSSPQIPSEVKFSLASAVGSSGICKDDYNITVKINALLTGDRNSIIEEARIKKDLGYDTFKLKLGEFSVGESVDLISQVRGIIGEKKSIVLDLNCQWELSKTLSFTEKIWDEDLLYIEDPVKELDELPGYFKYGSIKAGIDAFLENWELELEGICDEFSEKIVFIMKPSILYGSKVWYKVLGNRLSKKVFTSAWETGIGLRGILSIVFKYIEDIEFAGLDTYSFLQYDIVEPTLPIMFPQVSSRILKEGISVVEEKIELVRSWEI